MGDCMRKHVGARFGGVIRKLCSCYEEAGACGRWREREGANGFQGRYKWGKESAVSWAQLCECVCLGLVYDMRRAWFSA